MSTSAAGPSVRRPVAGEVIIDFIDGGGSFDKQKLEDHALATEKRRIERDEQRKKAKIQKALDAKVEGAVVVKDEDVNVIVSELDIPTSEAEAALTAANGDLQKALGELISPSGVKIGINARS